MNVRALFLFASVAASACVSVASAFDQVLVVSAQKELLHASSSADADFTSAGLAELAMDALGLSTGKVEQLSDMPQKTLPMVQNPLQADVFQHANAYALVYVEDDDAALLNTIETDTTFTDAAFHQTFALNHRQGASKRVPNVLASEFKMAYGADATVKCAGSKAVCATEQLENTVATDAVQLEKVFVANQYLHKNVDADAKLAQELAQVSQLTASLSSAADVSEAFFVVGFSNVNELDSSKQNYARAAVAVQVGKFLSALQKSFASSGAQVVATSSSESAASVAPAKKKMAVSQDVMSYSRLLVSLANNDVDSGSDDDDDSGSYDSEDSGSGDDDEVQPKAANATTVGKVTLEEIAEYQIVLWTSVLLGVVLLLVILAMCNMDTGRDSLLYAKFIADAGHRKGD
uniref:Renin receptor-like C-terminal transmembrane spanning segment domain-containing protein n=1 Tax=Globisporangium ultimum (strain ATCC 200006 / CBS 805.95 / DAOM BR144) TaxID=431595 RepID=K3X5R4_GLOUD